jgi:serine/threonine protein kinase
MSQPTLHPDDVLQYRYRICSLLGHGGMGAIYRAWDTRLNIFVAIKEMVPQSDLNTHILTQLRQQFQQEAQVLARLNHPHLARVTDFFEESGNTYLVMDLVEGESLSHLIEQQGPLLESQVVTWADQLLDALAYCHVQRIIHRDIKPGNVIIHPNGRAVLVDFGLVKLWDPYDSRTQTAMRGVGTWAYAPPEQYDPATGHTDARSDIYSMGATLYHALTGRVPPTVTTRMVNPAALPPIGTLNPRVSPHTAKAVTKAMELRPADRFQSAPEMRAALLRQPAASQPQPARGTPTVRPAMSDLPTTAHIRLVLLESFRDEELAALCFDYFRDVFDAFASGTTKEQKVQLLIEHCMRRELIPKLFAAIQRVRDERYEPGFPPPQVRLSPPESERDPGRIFISHAYQDAQFVYRLADDLEKHGWRVWTTPNSSRPGEKWAEATDRGLAESGVFVLVVTPAAVKSQWVQDETRVAVELQHRGELKFIPLAVEQCDAPLLGNIYRRIPFCDSYEDGLKALLAELEQPNRAGKAEAERPVREKAERQVTPTNRVLRMLRDPMWQGIGAIVVSLACFLALLALSPWQRWILKAPVPTSTPTSTWTPSATFTLAPTPMPSPTDTATSAPSYTPTVTASPTTTSTPTKTSTATLRPTSRPTRTPMPTATYAPTDTPIPNHNPPSQPGKEKPPP